LLAVTRSAEGSLIASGDMVHQINAVPVERVVDTTGAGDLYAAGFLFGVTHGYSTPASGCIGAIAASEIISHVGARPEADLRKLVQRTL
jgi:sugar/nucleoside kinase (ribokinase family)